MKLGAPVDLAKMCFLFFLDNYSESFESLSQSTAVCWMPISIKAPPTHFVNGAELW